MNDEAKPRCALCQDWRMTKNEEAVTFVNGTAVCSWHAKEAVRLGDARLRAEVERLKENREKWTAEAARQQREAEQAFEQVEALKKERDGLILAVGEHITKRSEYLSRVKELEAEVARLREREKVLVEAASVALNRLVGEWNECGGGSPEHQANCPQCLIRAALSADPSVKDAALSRLTDEKKESPAPSEEKPLCHIEGYALVCPKCQPGKEDN